MSATAGCQKMTEISSLITRGLKNAHSPAESQPNNFQPCTVKNSGWAEICLQGAKSQ